MHRKSWLARKHFGSHLKELREKHSLSVLELSYILNVSNVSVYYWEQGHCFPCAIARLKMMAHLFQEIPQTLKDVLNEDAVRPSETEWLRFHNALEKRSFEPREIDPSKNFKHIDPRDDRYRIAFVEHLRCERVKQSITSYCLSRALGFSENTVSAWEQRGQFSRDFLVLGYLDRLYGGVIDVLFGICPKRGIHLRKSEIARLDRRLHEMRKPRRPAAWWKHCASLYRAARKWNYSQIGHRPGFVNRTPPGAF